MISLGIIGTYIAKIFDEVKFRPRYIISEKRQVKKQNMKISHKQLTLPPLKNMPKHIYKIYIYKNLFFNFNYYIIYFLWRSIKNVQKKWLQFLPQWFY